MGTYFHGSSEIQAGGDGLQTLILMNPNNSSYLGYSDTQPPQSQAEPTVNNFVFLNPSNNHGGTSSYNFLHAPLSHTQQLVGVPLTSASATSLQDHYFHHRLRQDVSPLHHAFLPRVQYNPYTESLDLPMAREVPRSQQVLALSLSPRQQNYGSFKTSSPLANISSASSDNVRVASTSSASGISNDVNGLKSVVLNSKYLKAAQELLDEVINVDKGVKSRGDSVKGFSGVAKNAGEASSEIGSAAGDGQIGRESGGKSDSELTTTERQEIQMKKAKLVNMLDEVEQRYRQYHHQMQIVVSWFEQAAGINSAKAYTALALQTISKQFRCLKDAILGQVRAANKKLGEEDSLGGKIGGSRLKFVDNQLRQQRALQRLGMIQQNAWRPQRGLPERSVSVLRAWLFEHFLHPYPKESDKLMLAKQTGLTRSQVSNWFINARVRLWKPMVEEMYTEEMKEQEKKVSEEKSGKHDGNEDSSKPTASPEKSSSSFGNQNRVYISNQDPAFNPKNASPASASPETSMNIHNQSSFNLIGSSEMETMTQGRPKKQRATVMLHSTTSVPSIKMDENHGDLNEESLSMKFNTGRHSREGFSLLGGPTNFIEGFGSYPIAELGRFSAEQFQSPYSGNGFSLTLGLPQCENLTMSVPHQPFLPNQNMPMGRGVEIGDTTEYGNMNTSTSTHSTGIYENINMQNGKRFSAQLLPDFVA